MKLALQNLHIIGDIKLKKKTKEITSNKEFITAITVPLLFSGVISIIDISLLNGDILWNIDWISFMKTFELCIYSTVFPNIFIELFFKDSAIKDLREYLVLLIFAVICFILLGLALLIKSSCIIVISSILSILLLITSSYCFYL